MSELRLNLELKGTFSKGNGRKGTGFIVPYWNVDKVAALLSLNDAGVHWNGADIIAKDELRSYTVYTSRVDELRTTALDMGLSEPEIEANYEGLESSLYRTRAFIPTEALQDLVYAPSVLGLRPQADNYERKIEAKLFKMVAQPQ